MLFDNRMEIPPALRHFLTEVPQPSRRLFLKMSVASGFALACLPEAALANVPVNNNGTLPANAQPGAFLQIDRDGRITVTVNRLEFGQGVQTALPLILAEELDADWAKVGAKLGTNDPAYADPKFGIHLTGGSNSIKNSFVQYRELGARARGMLLQAAAKVWNLPVAQLRTDSSKVIAPDGRQLGYGELADKAMGEMVPQEIRLKDAAQFRLIGKATNRLDAADKSHGRQQFGLDVRLPGLLTAVVARPPVFGASIQSLDDSEAIKVQGVRAILRIATDRGGQGVAVIADGYWAALQARNKLKISWDNSKVTKADTTALVQQYRELSKRPGAVKWDADVSKIAKAPHKLQAEFSFPYLAHAPMEPLNCTVAFTGQKAELWMGTQMPGFDGMAAAKVLGIKPEAVKVNTQMAGGGFGRRAVPTADYVAEACAVVKAAMGAGLDAPVKTVWSREDDIRGGYYRPLHLHRAEIGFDQKGNILGWDHTIVGQSIVAGTLFEGMMIKDGIDGTITEGMRDPYDIPMRLQIHHPKVNVPVLWWRSVGSTHTAYVMETLLDEIAVTTGQDPVAYRLKLMADKHPRHAAALKLAVEKSGYGKKLPRGQAWGVAVHESFESVVAYVVVASLQKGKPRLLKVTAGVHCNLAVNPRGVEAQVQGAALMALSTCLPGNAITLKDGAVEQSNFHDYPVARITDMPQIAVHIVASADAPKGMGEPGLPPLAPAFANALARLDKKRQRELPFKFA